MYYLCTTRKVKEIFSYKVPFNKQAFNELARKMIYIGQVLGFEEKNWVSTKEMELLVELVRQYALGIPLASRESVEEVMKNTTLSDKNKEIYIYRHRLKTKGWIAQTTEGFELVPFLRKLKPMPDNAELALLIQST